MFFESRLAFFDVLFRDMMDYWLRPRDARAPL
jgi:hypothetical protein